jgi:hypothetical protein
MTAHSSTRHIVEAIETHPVRWSEITLESALSWPVPVEHNGRVALSFFWYPVGGPINNRKIYPPYYRVVADLDGRDDPAFMRLEPGALGLRVPQGGALGSEKLPEMSQTEHEQLVDQLYQAVDRLVEAYPRPPQMLSASEREAARMYRASFNKLIEPPLLPAYRTLNPHFFDWLEAAGA